MEIPKPDASQQVEVVLLDTAAGYKVHAIATSESEVNFILREIFGSDEYFRHGISIPKGGVVLDVGANIGMFGADALTKQPDMRYIGVEPVTITYEALGYNLKGTDGKGADSFFALNSGHGAAAAPPSPGRIAPAYPDNITLLRAAVSDHSLANVSITFYPYMPGNSTLRPGEKEALQGAVMPELLARAVAIDAPAWTLHDLLRQQGVEQVSLLKVDVEGEELAVLRGLQEQDWRCIDQVIMEIHDCTDNSDGSFSSFSLEGDRGRGIDGTDIAFVTEPSSPEVARRAEQFGGLLPPRSDGRVMMVARLLRDKGYRVVIENTLGWPANYNAYATRRR